MAKLGARGRTEVMRLVRKLSDLEDTFNRKQYFVLMSDRTVLKKITYDVKDSYSDKIRHESGHYTVHGKIKIHQTDTFVNNALAHGFERVV